MLKIFKQRNKVSFYKLSTSAVLACSCLKAGGRSFDSRSRQIVKCIFANMFCVYMYVCSM